MAEKITEKEDQELSEIEQDLNGNSLEYIYVIDGHKVVKIYNGGDKRLPEGAKRSDVISITDDESGAEYVIGENAFWTEEDAKKKLAEEIDVFCIEDIPYKFERGDVVRAKGSLKGTEEYFDGTGVIAFRGFFNHSGQWDTHVLIGNKIKAYNEGLLEKVPDATTEEGIKRLDEFYETLRQNLRKLFDTDN